MVVARIQAARGHNIVGVAIRERARWRASESLVLRGPRSVNVIDAVGKITRRCKL